MTDILKSLGDAKGNMNPFIGELLRDVVVDRHGYHAAVPMETPEREGRPSKYCRRCGLRTKNSVHTEPVR